MQTLRKFMVLALVFSFFAHSVYGQPCYDDVYDDNGCGEAYCQSSNSAHWSVYIPIALIVGAAIWFGVADSSSSGTCEYSSSCKDGLGSLGSRSSHCNRSSSYSSYCSRSSSSCHCH